jgi:hypothetical protein
MPSSDTLFSHSKEYFQLEENAEVGLATRPDQHALRGDRL